MPDNPDHTAPLLELLHDLEKPVASIHTPPARRRALVAALEQVLFPNVTTEETP